MEVSVHSLLHLLQKLSEAVGKKPGADYDDLLLKIFEEKFPHDADEKLKHLDSSAAKFKSKHEIAIASRLRCIGRHDEKNQLSSKLLGPDIECRKNQMLSSDNNMYMYGKQEIQVCFIPIFGAGGMGKTTLTREVYESPRVQKYFELRAWVKVSGQEIMLQAVAREILKSATGMSFRLDDLEELDEIVRDTLQSHKCLIVFDEIESMTRDSWQHMKNSWFSVMGLGSRVLVTTSSIHVSNLVANIPFELLEMSYKDADQFLRKFEVSLILRSNILSLSQGIPLSLKLMMGLVTCDKKLADLLSSPAFLNNITMPVLRVPIVILLSIWSLPWHLIQCLAFCAIFPRGYMINRQKLIEKWIAHGLIVSGTEHAGGAYFHNLLCRSFFTDITWNEYGDIEEFRLPGLIHDIVQDVTRIVFQVKVGVVWISEDAGQLSLYSPQTTHIFPITISSSIHQLHEFKHLHTLDLSSSGIQSLSDEICALEEVRYINLSYTLIERLPDSITELPCLKSLDLSGCCYLQVLPERMCDLVQLRHLDLQLCDTLSYIPSGICFLTSLKSMTLFVLGKDEDKSAAGLGEIGSLNQLRGKLQIKNLENVRNNSEALDAKLNKKFLRHLELSWSQKGAANHSELLEILRPNPGLKVLHLTGYMGIKFPSWMLSIKCLTKISINDCECEELPSLGQLHALKELQLKGMANLISISSEFYGYTLYKSFGFFPSLEQLGLYDMPILEVWSCSSSHVFPRLKTLTIEGCPQLRRLPSLPRLPDLIVCNSHRNILSSLSSFGSLSSLLINDMEDPSRYFVDLLKLKSLKKLIIFSNKVENGSESHDFHTYTALEHLSILQCNRLRHVLFGGFTTLQKLHILDCQELIYIDIPIGKPLPLIELVIQECPRAQFRDGIFDFPYLRKLIMKSCYRLEISPGKFKELKDLEYLFISECPQMENQLWKDPSQISDVPCVILGSHKVEHETYFQQCFKNQIGLTDDSKKNRGGVPTTERSLLELLEEMYSTNFDITDLPLEKVDSRAPVLLWGGTLW